MCRLIRHLLRCVRWSLLLCLLVLLPVATCSASGTPAYQVTAQELAELQSNLTRLQELNSELRQTSGALRNQLVDCQTELTQAREQLTAAETQSQELQRQLARLTERSKNQEALLIQVNQSFQRYSSEQKKTRLRIKAQRNAWQAASVLLAVGLALK